MALLSTLMLLVVFIVTILSSISDVRSLTIPNRYSLVILFCFVPAWLAAPQVFSGICSHLAAMGIMLAVSYALFSFNVMGGGDSKLATALALWVGLKGIVPFLFYMSLIGGLIGVAALVIQKKKPFKNPLPGTCFSELQNGRNAVPYGVAISCGVWLALAHSGFLHNQLNEVIKIIS